MKRMIRWCEAHGCEVHDPRSKSCLLWGHKKGDCDIHENVTIKIPDWTLTGDGDKEFVDTKKPVL